MLQDAGWTRFVYRQLEYKVSIEDSCNGRLYIASPVNLVPLYKLFSTACILCWKWRYLQTSGTTSMQKSPPVIFHERKALWSPVVLLCQTITSLLITFLVSKFSRELFKHTSLFFLPLGGSAILMTITMSMFQHWLKHCKISTRTKMSTSANQVCWKRWRLFSEIATANC